MAVAETNPSIIVHNATELREALDLGKTNITVVGQIVGNFIVNQNCTITLAVGASITGTDGGSTFTVTNVATLTVVMGNNGQVVGAPNGNVSNVVTGSTIIFKGGNPTGTPQIISNNASAPAFSGGGTLVHDNVGASFAGGVSNTNPYTATGGAQVNGGAGNISNIMLASGAKLTAGGDITWMDGATWINNEITSTGGNIIPAEPNNVFDQIMSNMLNAAGRVELTSSGAIVDNGGSGAWCKLETPIGIDGFHWQNKLTPGSPTPNNEVTAPAINNLRGTKDPSSPTQAPNWTFHNPSSGVNDPQVMAKIMLETDYLNSGGFAGNISASCIKGNAFFSGTGNFKAAALTVGGLLAMSGGGTFTGAATTAGATSGPVVLTNP